MVSKGTIVLGLVAILGIQSSAGIHHVLEACASENGVTMDDAEAFMRDGSASPGLKCSFKCIMQKINVIKDDGTMDVDIMVAMNPPDKADLVRKCSTLPPGDPCENSYLHYKCALDNDREYFTEMYKRLTTEF